MGRSRYYNFPRQWLVWLPAFLAGILGLLLGLRAVWPESHGAGDIIHPGTALTVQLLNPISSEFAHLGDTVEARIVAANGPAGPITLPSDATVNARCVAVRQGQGVERPGYLRFALTGMRDSRGHRVLLETTTVSRWGSGEAPEISAADIPQPPAPPETPPVSGARINSIEAVVAPNASLTFILLKPAIIPAHWWEP